MNNNKNALSFLPDALSGSRSRSGGRSSEALLLLGPILANSFMLIDPATSPLVRVKPELPLETIGR